MTVALVVAGVWVAVALGTLFGWWFRGQAYVACEPSFGDAETAADLRSWDWPKQPPPPAPIQLPPTFRNSR